MVLVFLFFFYIRTTNENLPYHLSAFSSRINHGNSTFPEPSHGSNGAHKVEPHAESSRRERASVRLLLRSCFLKRRSVLAFMSSSFLPLHVRRKARLVDDRILNRKAAFVSRERRHGSRQAADSFGVSHVSIAVDSVFAATAAIRNAAEPHRRRHGGRLPERRRDPAGRHATAHTVATSADRSSRARSLFPLLVLSTVQRPNEPHRPRLKVDGPQRKRW